MEDELHRKGELEMKNIHYFQRYHKPEDVHTANAMLLLSRLYHFSPNKFYDFIKPLFKQNGEVDLTLQIGTQDKKGKTNTIPDAVILQESFKIVVETKLANNFSLSQLKGHLEDFNDEHNKLLLTLDCEEISDELHNKINELCEDKGIIYTHLTFETLIDKIREQIDDKDYDFFDVIDDYEAYCIEDGLLPTNKYKIDMRIVSDTFDKNMELGLYYYGMKGSINCDYLGLYKNKSMRAIGKIIKKCEVEVTNKDLVNPQIIVQKTDGDIINDVDKERIIEAIKDSPNYGYNLAEGKHRFFIVDKFYETDFKKINKYAPRGKKIFDIRDILGTKNIPETKELAERLKQETWE